VPGHPLVSIVTPSFNMGEFVEQTICSVLSQDYPEIEYVVMDGGSTDETLAILERYRNRLRYLSARDSGAADAIRQGLERTHGEIVAYVNADDMYLPEAVRIAVEALDATPSAAVAYGDGVWVDEAGLTLGSYPTRDFDSEALARECFICQPAAFIRRSAYDAVGGIDPALSYTFDYDLWLRLARHHDFVHVPRPLAKSRMHRGNMTFRARRRVLRETVDVLLSNNGYAGFGPVYAYACHLVDRADQFFEPLRPSVPKYLLAILLGMLFNSRGRGRFLRDSFDAIRPRRAG
jgi:glycosyltransferase involved in cell wall biosynthesis